LPPTLKLEQVVDKLGAHEGSGVREWDRRRGCELVYLPPYSLNCNPVEEAFSKIKRFLRELRARVRGALVEARDRALDAVSARGAESLFEHSTYRALRQRI
jgi:transposase